LYRENEEGRIENVYVLKIMNKAQRQLTYEIEADGLDGLVYEGKKQIVAAEGEILTVPVELSIDPEKLPSSTNEIEFRIQAIEDPSIKSASESRFIGPSIR
jgi:polyferredoxin